MTALDAYQARIDAVNAQRRDLALVANDSDRWSKWAEAFRFNPRRELDANEAAIAALVRPDDHVVDVGGGAGRVGLPLALRCRALTNAEPSPGMGDEFLASAREAGITNATLERASWLDAEAEGDFVLSVDVVYFVREIDEFVLKLDRSASRRAAIWIWSPTPPARNARLFEIAHGVPLERAPDHRELLPVMWEAGLLPEVRLLPEPFTWPERAEFPTTEEDAVAFALDDVEAGDVAGAAGRVADDLGELFSRDGGEWRPNWRPPLQGLLITWETGGADAR
ncbi:MAG: class I SAM-dependent methyltransferase [Dehalococcoidia bacterium]|nr:class I SAM-dependent methyltransferase [Dehalococcoidia bacterium]